MQYVVKNYAGEYLCDDIDGYVFNGTDIDYAVKFDSFEEAHKRSVHFSNAFVKAVKKEAL